MSQAKIDDFHSKYCILKGNGKNMITGETVEKVPKQIIGGDAEKNDFTECATINDLTIMKGCETPQNQAVSMLVGFPTVSEVSSERGMWVIPTNVVPGVILEVEECGLRVRSILPYSRQNLQVLNLGNNPVPATP